MTTERALDSAMNELLREQYETIGTLFVSSTTNSAKRGYAIGECVRTIMLNPRAYGPRAVLIVAKALGKKPGVLYDAAKVASVWDKEEFFSLLERPNRYRQPLSFSHFVTLAEITEHRMDAFEKTLAEGWSVRELRRRFLVSTVRGPELAHDAVRRMQQHISQLVDAVDHTLRLLPTFGPEAARREIEALRKLKARMSDAFSRFEPLVAERDKSTPSNATGWGELGETGQALRRFWNVPTALASGVSLERHIRRRTRGIRLLGVKGLIGVLAVSRSPAAAIPCSSACPRVVAS